MSQRVATATTKTPIRLDVAVFAVFFGVVHTVMWFGRQIPNDWASLWIAGLITRTGETEHLYDYDPHDFSLISGEVWWRLSDGIGYEELFPNLQGHPFVHTPGVAYAVGLMTEVMSFPVSVGLLTFFNAVAVVYMITSSISLWSPKPVSLSIIALASVALAASEPVQFAIAYGQTSPLIYTGVVFAMAHAARRPVIAGIMLGIVASIKLTPLALIAVLALFPRRRMAAAVAAVTSVVALGASFLLGGPDMWSTWIANLHRIANVGLVAPANISLASIVMDQHNQTAGVLTLDVPPILRILPVVGCALMALLTLAVAVWFTGLGSDKAFALVMSEAVVLSSIYSNIVWSHYFICVVVLVVGIAFMDVPEWLRCAVPVAVSMFYYRMFPGAEELVWRPAMLVGAVVLSVGLLGMYVWSGLRAETRGKAANPEIEYARTA